MPLESSKGEDDVGPLLKELRDCLVDGDAFVAQTRVTQPEVHMQLLGPALCQAVCGSRKRGKEEHDAALVLRESPVWQREPAQTGKQVITDAVR